MEVSRRKTLVLTTNGARDINEFAYIIKCRETDAIYYAHPVYNYVYQEFAEMALKVMMRGDAMNYQFIIE